MTGRSDDLDRLIATETDDCVEWPYSLSSRGYGQLHRPGSPRGRPVGAHVLACERVRGQRPSPELQALHTCDNKRCVNGRHLYWGTRAENSADWVRRGVVAARHLTADDVREIRQLYASGTYWQSELAARFDIDQTTISRIVRGVTWTWVDSAAG